MAAQTWKKDIPEALCVLRAGGVLAFPTETTYGIGCDPRDKKAVKRIFELKGRHPSKPLLLVAYSWSQIHRLVVLKGHALDIAKKFWPGPLTLILPARKKTGLVPGVVVYDEVAIRFSSSPIVQTLVRRFGFPIVATSANRSGKAESHSAKEVKTIFDDDLNFIVNGGALPQRKPSTVARVQEDGTIEVLRQGRMRL